MVLRAEKQSKLAIDELRRVIGEIGNVRGNVENAAITLNKDGNTGMAKHLAGQASDLLLAENLIRKIISLLSGEIKELEKERDALLREAKQYKDNFLKSLAER